MTIFKQVKVVMAQITFWKRTNVMVPKHKWPEVMLKRKILFIQLINNQYRSVYLNVNQRLLVLTWREVIR